MALPLPNYLSEEQGGGILNSMAAGNTLANANHLRRYNQAKADYAPETLLAQAASQAAYANNVGPQYIAKILQDAGFKGNTSDPVLRQLVEKVQNAGMMGNPLINTLNQRILERYRNGGQQHKNPLSFMLDKLMNIFHPGQQQGNALASLGQQQMPQPQVGNSLVQGNKLPQQQPQPQGNMQPQNQPESFGQVQGGAVDENGNRIPDPTPDELQKLDNMDKALNPNGASRSYQQNEAGYEGGVAQGKEAGKLNAQDVNDIGKQNLALSAASTNLDAIIKDFNDPVFESMRAKIPGFQKKQLSAIRVLGTPEEKEKIGKFIGDIRQYAQATINSFRGPATGREFNFANDLKPTEDDNIPVIRGKAQSLKELNKIAYKKNQIISQLMDTRNKNPMTLTDAVEEANKRVDVSKIQKEVNRLVHPTQKTTKEDIEFTAKEMGISPEEVIKRLKAKGIYRA